MSNTSDWGPDFGGQAGGSGSDGLPRAQGNWDKLSIINEALIASANSTVTTADDGSDEWRVASSAYERQMRVLLYRRTWTFATLIEPTLQRLGDSPEPGYGDVFAKPQNCMYLDAVWRSDLAALVYPAFLGTPSEEYDTLPPALDYIVIGDQIHTTAELGAAARYVPYPDTSSQPWSIGFVECLRLYIEAACFDGLNEDFSQGMNRRKMAEMALNEAAARSDSEQPRKVAFRSRVMERRRGYRGWF